MAQSVWVTPDNNPQREKSAGGFLLKHAGPIPPTSRLKGPPNQPPFGVASLIGSVLGGDPAQAAPYGLALRGRVSARLRLAKSICPLR